ncbi:MAG: YebC/PmpR family DNA-binding transcriptional regulator [Proteobacteria bacterium]|nr:YebC/PmpR family DNA-binding transcriptional regulator [Pseudomonadota bacterium]
MAGHSKWAQIKHKKAVVDAKRGKIFTKIAKEITVAVRLGGKDPEMNPRLRTVIAKAKSVNMPNENIERAIKKGTGELADVQYEEITYEGYGPGGVAVLVEAMTDNKNRTVGEIRHLFSKYNGNLGESGCVSWLFEQKGYFVFDGKTITEDELMEIAIEAGAEDVRNDDGSLEVITDPADFERVKEEFDKRGLKYNVAEITKIPKNYVQIKDKDAENMIKLFEALEDHDDVQNVYANFDLPDDMTV